jgi:hypothetical protein
VGFGKLIFDVKTPEFVNRFIVQNVKIYSDEKSGVLRSPSMKNVVVATLEEPILEATNR